MEKIEKRIVQPFGHFMAQGADIFAKTVHQTGVSVGAEDVRLQPGAVRQRVVIAANAAVIDAGRAVRQVDVPTSTW
ncbi:MAG TPA: hypothetical protein VIZ18_04095 [Ktedonobacteraceae bacterium]